MTGGGLDAIALLTLAAPWMALAVVLGVEHGSEGLGFFRRLLSYVAVILIVATVLMNSAHRTSSSQDADLQTGKANQDHDGSARSSRRW